MLSLFAFVSVATAAPVFTDIGGVGLGAINKSAESCSYDSVNGNWIFSRVQGLTEITTLPGGSEASYTVKNVTEIDSPTTNLGIPLVALGQIFIPGASESDPNYLYIANLAQAAIARFNVDTNVLELQWATGVGVPIDNPLNPSPFGFPNGLCYDKANNVIYATVTGINPFATPSVPFPDMAALFAIDLSANADSPTVTRYDLANTNVTDQNGDIVMETNTLHSDITGPYYRVHPNGCVVTDGKVLMIETRASLSGYLAVFDIATGVTTVNTELITETGDGLIQIDEFIIASTFSSKLLWYKMANYPEGTFETGYTGKFGADIDFNPANNIICLPDSVTTGSMFFVQFTPPPPTEMPTASPNEVQTGMPTVSPVDADTSGANFMTGIVAIVVAVLAHLV